MRFTLDGETFDLTPETVRARLEGHAPEDIRNYWVEVDGTRWPVKQVISLATGVKDRQRFQSQSSRRWLQKLGFTIGSGGRAIPRAPGPATAKTTTPVALVVTGDQLRVDVVLVGCVKTKLAHGAPARDLYVSDYFIKMRTYAEATGKPWFILSAEHGLVGPDEWLEPYERYLPETSRDYQQAWGERVVAQLRQAVGELDGLVIDIHAGSAYVVAVEGLLQATGAHVLDQLQGLSFGRRLSWYLQQQGRVVDQSWVLERLRDFASAKTLNDILDTQGDGLRSPGMYSWWVDAAGASELTRGLGHPVGEGLIYGGLAGATRSGGSTSTNTLWGRIATVHLGKKSEFSTLRRSLGSILAAANEQASIDEVELTRWMHAHLRVVPIPVADADTLDALETALLTELDPPLNLAKVSKTPVRQQLSILRKRYGTTNQRA
jgi:hypothetical protein